MKHFLLLGAAAIALSGCVSGDPGYGSGTDPYRGAYDARPTRGYQDRYRPVPVYRDARVDDRRFERERDRDDRRYDRRDDRTYDEERPASRRYDRRDAVGGSIDARPERRAPETRPQGSSGSFRPRIVTGQVEGASRGPSCEQGVFNDCGTAQNAGPQPYRPPISRDN